MLGRTVGHHLIEERRGEANHAAIYGAVHTASGRRAIVEILHPWLSRDPAVVQRLERETRAAARLQNPHVASIQGYGRMPDGSLYLTKEDVRGTSLAQCLHTEGRLEPARAVAIATQCLEGLAETHRHGVVHGALEPAKIVLVPRGGPDFVKLVDVGITLLRPSHEDANGRRRSGNPRYMAPEQFSSDEVDHRADLYALGIVVYQMLAGRPPFHESSVEGYRRRHQEDAPPALLQAAPKIVVPAAIDACVMRALAKSPHHRPQSADAFADELWAALMATVEGASLPAMPRPRSRPRRRSRVGMIAGLGAVCGAITGVAIGAYLFLRSGPTPEHAGTPTSPGANEANEAPSTHEIDRLTERSLDELETILRETIAAERPASHAELTIEAYREAVAHLPEEDTTTARALLVELVLAWRASAFSSDDPRSLDELEAAFLTMPSPFGIDVRRSMLNRLKQAARQDPDPRSTIRAQLGPWIAAYGENADSHRAEPQIEILEGEGDG